MIGMLITALGGGAGLAVLVHRRRDAKRKDADTEKVEAETEKVAADATQVIAVAAAEAAQVLTAAATGLVAPLQQQVTQLQGRATSLEGEVAGLRHDMIERDVLAAEHAGWDKFVELEAQRAGLALPARPPLIPPRARPAPTTRH